jgi:hypothetical protein
MHFRTGLKECRQDTLHSGSEKPDSGHEADRHRRAAGLPLRSVPTDPLCTSNTQASHSSPSFMLLNLSTSLTSPQARGRGQAHVLGDNLKGELPPVVQFFALRDLFDHLVGGGEQRFGNDEAKRPRRSEVDDELELD